MNDEQRARHLVEIALETGRSPRDVCADAPELLADVTARWERARSLDAHVAAVFSSTGPAIADPGTLFAPTIPGYVLEAVLGRGGMGVAYRARRADSPEAGPVALKVVHSHLLHLPGFHERFLREAELGRLIDHENVVRTLGAGTAPADAHDAREARIYLILEHVEGQTLRQLLDEMGALAEPMCRHVGRAIARGLAAIHAVGAVHRDIKPENIMVARVATDGQAERQAVKVMDLGVARLAGATDDLSRPEHFLGSLRHAAPEQVRRDRLDGRTDLYALGVTLYELATGEHPVPHGDVPALVRAILEESPRRPSETTPQLSPFFEELLLHLLRKDPGERPSSAEEVARILDEGESSAWWISRSAIIRARELGAPRRMRVPRETAVHGRDGEFARLRLLLEHALAGEGQVVVIEGEAGIGKSRLVDEFIERVRRERSDVAVLRGGYAPGGMSRPGSALASALCDHFGEDNLEAILEAHVPQAAATIPSFAAYLRGDAPTPGRPPLPREAVQALLARTLQSLARRRPVILLVEDMHFAPGSGPSLFGSLARANQTHRLLLVATARPNRCVKLARELGRLPHVTRLELSGLDGQAVQDLLAEALGSAETAATLAPTMCQWTAGNPYLALQVLQDLRTEGLIERDETQGWRMRPEALALRSAPSVERHVSECLAGLREDEREVILVAACVGHEFDPDLVGRVLGIAPLRLFRLLAVLEREHRLVRAIGRHHAFDHHHVHEAILALVGSAHGMAIHAALAEEIERSLPPGGRADGRQCVSLARHFLASTSPARALAYFDAALAHLTARHEHEPALELCRAALGVPGMLEGADRLRLLLARSLITDLAGLPEEQLSTLLEAGEIAEASGDAAARARVRWDMGSHLTRLGRFDEARAALEEAVEAYREIGDLSAELGATGHLAVVHTRTGRPEIATALNERCIVLASEHGDLRAEEMARTSLGMTFHALGRFEESCAQHERSLALCRQLADRRGEARTLSNLGNVLHSMGMIADALTCLRESARLVAELGDREGEARAAVNLGIILHAMGHHDEASSKLGQGRDLTREVGSPHGEAVAVGALAHGLSARGRHAEALPLFQRAAEIARAIGSRQVESDAMAGAGATLAKLGRIGEACAELDEAIVMAREVRYPTVLLVASAERATLPGGDVEGARAVLLEVGSRVEARRRMQATWRLWQATRDPGLLAAARSILDRLIAHAPPDSREAMTREVVMHAEILATTDMS